MVLMESQQSHSSSGLVHDVAGRATQIWRKPSQVFRAAQWPFKGKAIMHFRVLAAGVAIHSILCYIFGNMGEKRWRMGVKGDIVTWHSRMSLKSPSISVFWDKNTETSSTARMQKQRKVLINYMGRQWLGKKSTQHTRINQPKSTCHSPCVFFHCDQYHLLPKRRHMLLYWDFSGTQICSFRVFGYLH